MVCDLSCNQTLKALLPEQGGAPIKILEWETFDLQLGPVKLTRELVVAEIDDQCILADDLIHGDPDSAMDVINSHKVVMLKG